MFYRRSNRNVIAILLVFIFIASPASSTVILLLVTPDAVVIGTDSKSTTFSNGSPMHSGEHEKVVSIAGGQIIIGDVGLAKIERDDTHQEIYNFPTWARALNIEAETPIMQVARAVASDSFGTMKAHLSQKLSDGTFSAETMGQTNPSLSLVGYYIGKCDAKGCSAVSIDIAIDWKKRILNPPKIKVVSPSANSHFSFLYNSVEGGVLDRFLQENSPTKQLYLQTYPKEIGPVFRNQILKPEELVSLAKLLLSLEINDHPDLYSFPVVVYSLSAHHPARRHEYKQ